jgi:hypothetical protein
VLHEQVQQIATRWIGNRLPERVVMVEDGHLIDCQSLKSSFASLSEWNFQPLR